MIPNKVTKLFDKYKLDDLDREYLESIMVPIINHPEFQRRMTREFSHHGTITLGEHIIEDAIVTYIIAKKSKKKVNLDLAVKIAMFHDLYTVPWQSVKKVNKEKSFFNKHGFRHPIESVINAYCWYPDEFKNVENAKIIIDGIIHHMYPLPVAKYSDSIDNVLELKNYDLLSKLPPETKKIIYESTNRGKTKRITICKSLYIEGKIMAKADKKVSIRQFKNINSIMAIFSGINKKIERK